MRGGLAYTAVTAIGLLLTAVTLFAGIILFDAPATPGPATAEAVPDAPARQTLAARDGALLAYRLYPGRPETVVVLVHGSSSSSLDMHRLAQALQVAGATVYSLDLRGHGGSGLAKGDTAYVGQLEDDLVDLVRGLGLYKPGSRRTLIGFSAGGGFVLRIASGPLRGLFDDYLAISPYITGDADILRSTSGYANIAAKRIAVLASLERFGLPILQDLTVVRYAAPADQEHTPSYSYRLLASLRLDANWRAALQRITTPTIILLAGGDRPIPATNPHIQVQTLRDYDHLQMIANATAAATIASSWKSLKGQQ
jgi:alpha-beta hydrolase superfamily lysophospholipase